MSKNFRKLCASPQDSPSCALFAVFGIFSKSRYRQTCWVNSIHCVPKMGGGIDVFRSGEARMSGEGDEDEEDEEEDNGDCR